MKRKSVKSVTIDQNIRCQRIIPVEGSNRQTADLHTVGFRLTKVQAIQFATVLLVAAQEWDIIDVTGFRLEKRSDGTFPITITSVPKAKKRPNG